MTDLIVSKIDAMRAGVDDLKSSTALHIKTLMEGVEAAKAKAADADAEAKKHGAAFADTKAVVERITGEMADSAKALQELKAKGEKLHEALEKLNADLALQVKASSTKDDEAILKAARDFYAIRHYGEAVDGSSPDDFNESKVNEDSIKAYKAAKDLFWGKVMRMPVGIGSLHAGLTQDELKTIQPLMMTKSISTITHGNRFWLTSEMGYEIQCWDEVTDLGGLFASMWISRGAVEMIRSNDVEKRALFKCELDCNPARGNTPAQPGTVTIPVHEMTDHECITHTMLEDSEIDLQAWLIPRVAEGFTRGRNEKFLWGSGTGEPMGLLRPGGHISMPITPINGSAAGHITWQHLRIMPFQVAKRFQSRGSYIISRDALMSIFTMADADGKPLIDSHLNVGMDGIMRLWGYPIYQIDQLQNYLTPGTPPTPTVGAKPVGFGSWMDAYMVVNRRGFFVVRDPAYNPCGVTWWFGQRVGGGVLCENASAFLEVV